jgi:hypothetical protein
MASGARLPPEMLVGDGETVLQCNHWWEGCNFCCWVATQGRGSAAAME